MTELNIFLLLYVLVSSHCGCFKVLVATVMKLKTYISHLKNNIFSLATRIFYCIGRCVTFLHILLILILYLFVKNVLTVCCIVFLLSRR